MVAITHPGSLRTATFAPRPPRAAMYRRRRLALAGVLALVVAVGLLLAEVVAHRTATSALGTPVARVSVVVAPGDTVWSIAADLAGADDPRPIVDAIVDANGGASLVAGQRLDITVP